MKIGPTLLAVGEYIYLIFKSLEFIKKKGNIHNIVRTLTRIVKTVRCKV